MKILIAEDDQDQLRLRTLLFEQSGHEAFAASNSNDALQLAKSQKPECAVVDWRFPTEEAGLWLIRALKQLNDAIRVFVLTGGDPARFDALPEKRLVEEVILKGSSSAYLLKKLDAQKMRVFEETLAREGVVTFDVKALPRSSRNEIVGFCIDGPVKIRVTAAPDKGKANEQVCELLAEFFKVAKSKVEIVLGETSQKKRVRISR